MSAIMHVSYACTQLMFSKFRLNEGKSLSEKSRDEAYSILYFQSNVHHVYTLYMIQYTLYSIHRYDILR